MKRYFLISVLLVAMFAIFIVAGCSKKSPSAPDVETEELSELDKTNGGFDTSDEVPAFGDPLLATEFDDDEKAMDPITEDPALEDSINSNLVDAYFIRIVWGLLEFDSTATEAVDWSGSASVTKGKLGVLRKIKFEGNDQIIFPRPDDQTVEWISYTAPHYDGISLVIINRDTTDEVGQFTFSTSQYTMTFTYDELDSLEHVETVSENGHLVSIHAYNKKVIPFGGGFLEGRWVKNKEHGGEFFGRWIDRLGAHAGHLKGIWGINRQGEKVLYGKYINADGRFGGLLSGRWGYSDNAEDIGWFSSRWVNKSITKVGTIKGHWKAREDNPRKGFFKGEWRRVVK